MASQLRNKLTNTYYWSRTMLPYIVFFIIFVTSCAPPGFDQKQHDPPPPTRIVASFTPSRFLQDCADTFPLVSNSLFKSAAALVADMLDNPSTVNVNEGKIEVYISYIVGTNSYLKDAFAWSIDPIPDDPPEQVLTPTPSAAQLKCDSYCVANAQSTVQASNDVLTNSYAAQLNANHALLASARAKMKQYTNKLRNLPNINDPAPESVEGCLQSAQERMRGFTGRKTIILSSPLAEDVSRLPFIDLSNINIEVINWQCVLVSSNACIASRNAWQAKFLSFHAVNVSIQDSQHSQVVKPTF